jgi:hypothetical protein
MPITYILEIKLRRYIKHKQDDRKEMNEDDRKVNVLENIKYDH